MTVEAEIEAICVADVGDIVTMGNYGGEAVEWLVLAVKDNLYTMIAVKGQDSVPFNLGGNDGNEWSTSYIHTWLNDIYYNAAFSVEEQAMIVAGLTGDYVWLLSEEEVMLYFANNGARVCYPTSFALKNGAETDESGASRWWLRSPTIVPLYTVIYLYYSHDDLTISYMQTNLPTKYNTSGI